MGTPENQRFHHKLIKEKLQIHIKGKASLSTSSVQLATSLQKQQKTTVCFDKLKTVKFSFKMVCNMQESAVFEDAEHILESSYPAIPIPELETLSACQYLLDSAQENIKLGRTRWLVSQRNQKSKRGMRKGDVVLYMTSDVTRIYAFTVGVWRAGGIMYSSYSEDTSDTLLSRIQDAHVKWIVCDPISVPQAKAAAEGAEWPVELIVFGDVEGCTNINEIFEDSGLSCPDLSSTADLDDPLLILCTSGTTGKSKGAVYTNLQVLAFTIGTSNIPFNEAPALLVLRCTHVLGLLFPIRNLKAGVWSVLMHEVKKEHIFKAVDQYKPQLAFGFATFLALLATDPDAKNYDRSSLEVIITGGMVLTEKFYKEMMTLPGVKCVFNGYGMTECAALTTTIDLSGLSEGYKLMPNIPPLSCGKLYPNTRLKVMDIDNGRTLGANQQGEIAICSPIQCSGYWKGSAETGGAFQDGWMRTGDLGYYDEQGFVYVVDRIKETFKYFNCHISPAEIEEVALTHPAVEEAVVVGVEDRNGGDRVPRAFIVLKHGVEADEAIRDEIMSFVDDKVASYKRLRGGLYIVSMLPKNKTGKVSRAEIVSLAVAAPAC